MRAYNGIPTPRNFVPMSKFTLLTIGTVIIAVLIIVFAYLFSGSSTQAPNIPSGEVTLPTAESIPASEQIDASPGSGTVLATADGGAVATKDFLADPTTVEDPINTGNYYLGYNEVSTTTSNPPYTIEYIRATQFFNISLWREPLGETRSEAEQYLLTRLGVTQESLCRLNYMVSAPWWVNTFYGGKSLGFSFCPGAVVLPK